ncbi:TPA: hypothetical protein U1138_001999 [Streptococcus suis]|nr:hypothetical protein [Streptococcus suis]HEM4904138.1 hypothetical protein [Streptococcus suis]
MKEFKLPSIKWHDITSYFTRPKLEILSLIIILICALSVFTGRIASKQAMTFNNGALQYNGYVVANKMNGQGKLTFDNGDVYEGQFKNGIFHGQGTYTSASGWVYTGQFKNGYANGKGKLTTEGQATYEGTFKQGIYQYEN